MPAGPSEVEVLADETANPSFVAADFFYKVLDRINQNVKKYEVR